MRLSIFLPVVAFSSTILAQSLLGSIPACAQACFGSSTGSCTGLDVACICGSSTIHGVSCCAIATCSAADLNTTITFASKLCSAAGVTVDTHPNCSNSTTTNATASASASRSASASAARVSSTGAAAAFQTAGPALGLGAAMAGLLALL